MVTESGSNIIHEWVLTKQQRVGITSGNIHVAFFAIKQGSRAGVYIATTTPFTLNPQSSVKAELEQIATTASSSAIIIPTNVTKMRVRISTSIAPDEFKGNVYLATERKDYNAVNTVYSAMLQQNDLINLRVGKGDIINQINLSAEGVLIAGNKVHITGQTSIDNAVIFTSMIVNSAITNAKISTLDAGKINTENSGAFLTVLVFDPQAKVRSQAGFHLGIDLCTNGFNFRTIGNIIAKMTDLTLTVSGTSTGPFPARGERQRSVENLFRN